MTDTTAYNRHLPPARFALDVADELDRFLGPLGDCDGEAAADDLLALEVNGRPLRDWIAVGFAAVAARQAEIDAHAVNDRNFPRHTDDCRAARWWQAQQQQRLATLIGELPS